MSIQERDSAPEPATEAHSGSDDDTVFQSFGRCCNHDAFFADFYDRFLGSSEAIRAKFSHTNMKRQRYMLRDGILQLIHYARGLPDAHLHRLAQTHSKRGHDIPPQWYEQWESCLMDTLREHDPQFSPEVERAWHRVLAPGLALMKQHHH